MKKETWVGLVSACIIIGLLSIYTGSNQARSNKKTVHVSSDTSVILSSDTADMMLRTSQYYYNGNMITNPKPAYYGAAAVSGGGGAAIFYITTNGLSNGPAIYANVHNVTPIINDGTGNWNYGWVVSGDKRAVTVTASKSTSTNIAVLGLNLLGAPIAAANGTVITVTVKGN